MSIQIEKSLHYSIQFETGTIIRTFWIFTVTNFLLI